MNKDMWISVDKRSSRLIIRFSLPGFKRQFFMGTRLLDTPSNRELVRRKRNLIAADIALERFDPTLNSYRFRTAQETEALTLQKLEEESSYSLQELWERFTEFKASQVEKTTILVKYQRIANYISRFPTQSTEDAAKIRDWVLKNLSHYMAWETLNSLSRCCDWASDSGLISNNPFFKLKIPKPKNKSLDNDYKAFTLEQRDLIIQNFEEHSLFCHYAPLIKFLFWTGARPGEAFALTWGDISPDRCRIYIDKSCNLYRIHKGTKNGKKRIFPCESGSKLQKLLLDISPVVPQSAKLVFVSKTGRPMTSSIMFSFWNEWKSKSSTFKYLGLVKELANQNQVPYLKPYATRHTFATWAISSGVSPDKVALWIGDTVETVLTHYCHPEIVSAECPDF
ncbi:site-specific integrase [Nostoc sp. 'Lobaria pulmonaria (5183) cyanobiont']|uniref:site-specific integrase n=1 Tax=Nostoc sp. 'Lobaria pulmonaria (5183) cyanobiont' TaxID=1618022 RepID=UPI000CF34EEA|nr:site-specific integrase [Nostoc sp. 'Lobaria pulmonaria (5183) cyanobiont']AVH71569.1 Integrase/site-specific recombinase XerD [Nostoc sp. 'Lobaria pulmonaria (5183) cyanobiont']